MNILYHSFSGALWSLLELYSSQYTYSVVTILRHKVLNFMIQGPLPEVSFFFAACGLTDWILVRYSRACTPLPLYKHTTFLHSVKILGIRDQPGSVSQKCRRGGVAVSM